MNSAPPRSLPSKGLGTRRRMTTRGPARNSRRCSKPLPNTRSAAQVSSHPGSSNLRLAQALLMFGDWDTAKAELTQAADSDRLSDDEHLTCYRGWLEALRGDAATADTLLAGLPDLRVSDDPDDKSLVSLVKAFTAAARDRPQDVLRLARSTLAHAGAHGISHDDMRWGWPLAAHDLGDAAATGELLALLDSYPIGHLAPMTRAERDLACARLAASGGDPAAGAAFAAAITSLRELSTPYHLAHGLLDYVQYLVRTGDAEAAAPAVEEAGGIAGRLRCQPLLDRAVDLTPARTTSASPDLWRHPIRKNPRPWPRIFRRMPVRMRLIVS
jgi:hypothetical protein